MNAIPSCTDVMIDLECLAVSPTPVIMSVGACQFFAEAHEKDLHTKPYHWYRICPWQEQIDRGRQIQEATVRWWMKQSDTARDIMSEDILRSAAAACSPYDLLYGLQQWCLHVNANVDAPVRYWSHGKDFDLVILRQWFAEYRIECPWDYRQTYDTRTLFALCPPSVSAIEIPVDQQQWRHHAWFDAIWQAQRVSKAWSYLVQEQRKESTA